MSDSQQLDRLREKARHIRRYIIEMLAAAGSGHPGGSLSATDIVTCLYFMGDFASLEATGRRVVRLHLDSPEPGQVERVCNLIAGAVKKNNER